MPAFPSLKRSRPSIHQLYLIQRLQARQYSTTEPSSATSLSLIYSSTRNENENHAHGSSFRRWFSGIAVGSALGLFHWLSNSACDSQSSFFKRSLLSFADCPTGSTVEKPCSASTFGKLSLPDYSSKFIFGGGCSLSL